MIVESDLLIEDVSKVLGGKSKYDLAHHAATRHGLDQNGLRHMVSVFGGRAKLNDATGLNFLQRS